MAIPLVWAVGAAALRALPLLVRLGRLVPAVGRLAGSIGRGAAAVGSGVFRGAAAVGRISASGLSTAARAGGRVVRLSAAGARVGGRAVSRAMKLSLGRGSRGASRMRDLLSRGGGQDSRGSRETESYRRQYHSDEAEGLQNAAGAVGSAAATAELGGEEDRAEFRRRQMARERRGEHRQKIAGLISRIFVMDSISRGDGTSGSDLGGGSTGRSGGMGRLVRPFLNYLDESRRADRRSETADINDQAEREHGRRQRSVFYDAVLKSLGTVSRWAGEKIKGGIGRATSALGDMKKSLSAVDWMILGVMGMGALKKFISSASEKVDEYINGAKKIVTDSWEWTKSLVTDSWSYTKDALSDFWNGMSENATNLLNTLSSSWEWTKEKAGEFYDSIKSSVSGAIEGVKNWWADSSLKDVVDQGMGVITSFFGEVRSAIKSFIEKWANFNFSEWWDKSIAAGKSWLESVKGFLAGRSEEERDQRSVYDSRRGVWSPSSGVEVTLLKTDESVDQSKESGWFAKDRETRKHMDPFGVHMPPGLREEIHSLGYNASKEDIISVLEKYYTPDQMNAFYEKNPHMRASDTVQFVPNDEYTKSLPRYASNQPAETMYSGPVNPLAGGSSRSVTTSSEDTRGNLKSLLSDEEFMSSLKQFSKERGLDPDNVLSMMNYESSFRTGVVNRSGYKGLFQIGKQVFDDPTIGKLLKKAGFSYETFQNETAARQMQAYQIYYDAWVKSSGRSIGTSGNKMQDLAELAALQLSPAILKKGGSTMYRRGQKGYYQNSGLDVNGDGTIAKEEYGRKMFERHLEYTDLTSAALNSESETSGQSADAVQQMISRHKNSMVTMQKSLENIGSGDIIAPPAPMVVAPAMNASSVETGAEKKGKMTTLQGSVIKMKNQGKVRDKPLTGSLMRRLNEAIQAVYGEGYTGEVYSGGQDVKGRGNRRVGSTRHDAGKAADLYVIGPDGKRVRGAALGKLAQYWLAKGYGGVGLEMSGGGIHLDEHVDRPRSWNYLKEGGSYSKEQQGAVAAGLKGQLPNMAGSAPELLEDQKGYSSDELGTGYEEIGLPAPSPSKSLNTVTSDATRADSSAGMSILSSALKSIGVSDAQLNGVSEKISGGQVPSNFSELSTLLGGAEGIDFGGLMNRIWEDSSKVTGGALTEFFSLTGLGGPNGLFDSLSKDSHESVANLIEKTSLEDRGEGVVQAIPTPTPSYRTSAPEYFGPTGYNTRSAPMITRNPDSTIRRITDSIISYGIS